LEILIDMYQESEQEQRQLEEEVEQLRQKLKRVQVGQQVTGDITPPDSK